METYTPATASRDEIIRLWNEGYSQEKIIETLGLNVTKQRISQIIIKAKESGEALENPEKKVVRERPALRIARERKIAANKMYEEGAGTKQIAEKLGVKESTVRKYIGIDLMERFRITPQNVPETRRMVIEQVVENGKDVKELAEELGITVGRVYQILNEHGFNRRKPRIEENVKKAVDLLKSGYKTNEVAKMMNRSRETIARYKRIARLRGWL